jgi:hypothetical protein
MSFTRYLKALTGRDGSPADENRQINGSAESDKFHRRKKVGDFEGGGFRRVGAMRAIHLDGRTEIAANRARSGFFRVCSAHGFAPLRDSAIAFEDHGEDFPGAHEVREFAEKGTLAMHGIKTSGLFLREAQGPDGNDFETGFVNARENLALKIAANGIRLDDCESALNCHEKEPSDMKKIAGKMPALQNRKAPD